MRKVKLVVPPLPQPVRPSILDPNFKYTPAAKTDIAATFRRIRREQAEAVDPAALRAYLISIGGRQRHVEHQSSGDQPGLGRPGG